MYFIYFPCIFALSFTFPLYQFRMPSDRIVFLLEGHPLIFFFLMQVLQMLLKLILLVSAFLKNFFKFLFIYFNLWKICF